MRRIVFLTPEELPYGFAMAGFDQLPVADREAAEKLEKVVGEPETGVVVIDERLLDAIPEELLRQLQQSWAGIVLVLPSPAGALPVEEDYLQRLIRRALGYHVRIRG